MDRKLPERLRDYAVRLDVLTPSELALYTDLIAAADLLESDEWVSVGERAIPDDGGSYLVTDGHYVAPMVRGVIRNNTGTRNDFPWGIELTHWRPLPTPPGVDHD